MLSPAFAVGGVRIEHHVCTEHSSGLRVVLVFTVNISHGSGINNLACFLSAHLQARSSACTPQSRV